MLLSRINVDDAGVALPLDTGGLEPGGLEPGGLETGGLEPGGLLTTAVRPAPSVGGATVSD